MKLISLLSSLIHCHIIKIAYMTAYLMFMKSPSRLALGTFEYLWYLHQTTLTNFKHSNFSLMKVTNKWVPINNYWNSENNEEDFYANYARA
jgi:hypothetical protein